MTDQNDKSVQDILKSLHERVTELEKQTIGNSVEKELRDRIKKLEALVEEKDGVIFRVKTQCLLLEKNAEEKDEVIFEVQNQFMLLEKEVEECNKLEKDRLRILSNVQRYLEMELVKINKYENMVERKLSHKKMLADITGIKLE